VRGLEHAVAALSQVFRQWCPNEKIRLDNKDGVDITSI
jgi:hypothetical protein